MATICNYQHKKFDLKPEEYTHKKFGAHSKKRKHDDMQDKENLSPTTITADMILEKAQKDKQTEEPQAKRKQIKPLFRPWVDEENNTTAEKENKTTNQKVSRPPQVLSNISTNIIDYRPSMVRQQTKPVRSEKEQQRRNRNNLACLINRRNKQAEHLLLQQQYVAYQQQQAVMMEQSVRAALYLRHLQQLAYVQKQQQLFVFGQQQPH